MTRTILMVSGLLLAAASAGCIGGDDGKSDVQSVSTSTQTNLGNTTLSGSVSAGPGGAAGNGSVNDPRGNASAATSWSYDNRSGTISGNGAVVNVPFTKEESFTVENGTAKLVLNLTVEGHDLTLSLRAPDCGAAECAEEVKSQSGTASIAMNDPMEGDWVAVLELEGTGPVQAEYTLEIAKLAP